MANYQGANYQMNIGQELLALGVSNVAGAFFGAYPSAGSFSRTVVNGKSGSKSPMSNVITACLIVITLLAITKALYYIPYCALAAIIEVSVLNIIDFGAMHNAYRLNKQDFLVMVTSFLFTFFLGMEMGIMMGVLVSILLLVKETAVPHYAVLGRLSNSNVYRDISRYPDAEQQPEVAVFRFNARLYFGNCNFFRDKVVEVLSGDQDCLVIDASPINSVDLSALHVLEELNERVQGMQKIWAFANVKGPIRDFFEKSGFTKKIGSDHFFMSLDEAVDAAVLIHNGSFRRRSIVPTAPMRTIMD
jgi:SulP family sulfate permease